MSKTLTPNKLHFSVVTNSYSSSFQQHLNIMQPICKVQTSDFVEHQNDFILQFASWSHNIQMLLDDGIRIRIPQGNFKSSFIPKPKDWTN